MAVERKPGGPVFGPLPMLTEPAGEALIRVAEPKPHPMLLAVRELLRRELDRLDTVQPILSVGEMDYMRALSALHESLKDAEEPAVLMPIPGFHIRHQDGGHLVRAWYHVLLQANGTEARSQQDVSWHYYRWRARLAGNAWLKRAQLVSERIARELSSKIEVER